MQPRFKSICWIWNRNLRCFKLSALVKDLWFPRCPHNSCGSEVMAGWTQPEAPTPWCFWERVNMAGVSDWNEPDVYSMRDASGRESETGNGCDNGKRMMNGTSGTWLCLTATVFNKAVCGEVVNKFFRHVFWMSSVARVVRARFNKPKLLVWFFFCN